MSACLSPLTAGSRLQTPRVVLLHTERVCGKLMQNQGGIVSDADLPLRWYHSASCDGNEALPLALS